MPLLNTADALYMADREASHAFLGANRVFTNLELAIQKLFAAGEQGVWFDNAALDTLYEDSAGTTQASINGLVGLQLDRGHWDGRGVVNRLLWTSAFSNSAWTKVRASVVSNATTAPDGTLTADKLVEDTSTDSHYCTQNVSSFPDNTNCAMSISAKAGERSWLKLTTRNKSGTFITSWFNLAAGTVGTDNHGTGAMEDRGDGWYRCSVTRDSAAGGSGITIYPEVAVADGQTTHAGDGTSGIYIDGAQIEAGAVTAYQANGALVGGAGNHRYQATTAFKPILRGTPTGANVILNGGFDTDTVWGKNTGWSITGGVARATNPPNSSQYLSQTVPSFVPGVYQVTYRVTRFAGGQVRPVVFGTVLGVGAIRTAVGTYTDWVLMDAGSAGLLRFQPVSGPDCDFDIDDVEVRLANADDVAAPYFLHYDGVDDYLVTNAIDFTSTDKMTVWVGARKLSDTSTKVSVELGTNIASVNGSFALWLPHDPTNEASFVARGTTTRYAIYNNAEAAAPVTLVATGTADIAGDRTTLRLDGALVVTDSSDLGAGSFGNLPLYFGRRAGASLPFSGYEYQAIIRGAQSSASQIDDGEALTAQRTGVSLA